MHLKIHVKVKMKEEFEMEQIILKFCIYEKYQIKIVSSEMCDNWTQFYLLFNEKMGPQ